MSSSPTGAGPAAELQADFVRNTQHELRTPVTLIYGYATLLVDGSLGPLTPAQQAAAGIIAGQAAQLKALVKRISQLLSLEAGQKLILQSHRLGDILHKGLEKWERQARQAGVSLNIQATDALPVIAGEAQMLYQAIDCLVENAFSLTPAGGQIDLQAKAEDEWICLTVGDTGISLTDEVLQDLFNFSLEGGHELLTHAYPGVRLALAKRVAELHAGRLEVKSHPLQGNHFSLKLPVPARRAHSGRRRSYQAIGCASV